MIEGLEAAINFNAVDKNIQSDARRTMPTALLMPQLQFRTCTAGRSGVGSWCFYDRLLQILGFYNPVNTL